MRGYEAGELKGGGCFVGGQRQEKREMMKDVEEGGEIRKC